MTYKELMFSSLSSLLKDGETLECAVYGILNQADGQYYAYFGIAGDDLIVATLAGKSVAYTTRVPLDIKSLKIKQTLIMHQYVIDISFEKGNSLRITASPKVLTIDTQKENLPLFLNHLKSKSKTI